MGRDVRFVTVVVYYHTTIITHYYCMLYLNAKMRKVDLWRTTGFKTEC